MNNREYFISLLQDTNKTTLTKGEILDICDDHQIGNPVWFFNNPENRVKHGIYKVPGSNNTVPMMGQVMSKVMPIKKNNIVNIKSEMEFESLVPISYNNYVPFGNFTDISNIIKSNKFFPVFISGPSGNGKTISIEQACAKLNRGFVCVSMTPETDESDLLGNYVLVDGNMQWRDGPVTIACRAGAILCIDEIDYGSSNLSTLQRVLEGKPFLLKKKGEVITPEKGFNIFATANTKGKGSDSGRYMYTNILNESFLERFKITIEQTWPSNNIETRILENELVSMTGCPVAMDIGRIKIFADELVRWATVIRKTFDDGGTDEVVSTRRLVHIVNTFEIFGNKLKAIELCINRFDPDTKSSFIDLFNKITAEEQPPRQFPQELAPNKSW
jgi:hypothetical protein